MATIELNDDLLEELGFSSFSDEDKEAILLKIMEGLEMKMGMRVADLLTTEQLEEFNALTQAGEDEKARAFIKEAVPSYEDMAREELKAYIDAIKGDKQPVVAE